MTAFTLRTRMAPILLVACGMSTGCSSTTPLAAGDLARLQAEQPIVLAHRPPRLPFSVFTKETTSAEQWGSVFGPVGLGIGAWKSMSDAQKLGARLIGTYGLADPVATVEDRFIAAAASRGIATMRAEAEPVPSVDGPDLKRSFAASTVLVLRTYAWLVAYGSDQHRYSTLYRAQASLVRGYDGVVVWSAICPTRGPGADDPASQLSLPELTANNGELLRARFAERASACADHLLNLFFSGHN